MENDYQRHETVLNTCEKCGNEINAECTIIIKGKKVCRDCIETAVFRTNNGQKVSGTKSTALCFFLSLIPGAGHIYLGLKNKGLVFMSAFFGVIVLADFFNLLTPIFGLIWIYSFIDSLTSCSSLNKGEILQDIDLPAFEDITHKVFSNKKMVGIVFIGLGVLGLLRSVVNGINSVLRQYFDNWHYISFEDLALALIFLALGSYLLNKSGRQEGKNG